MDTIRAMFTVFTVSSFRANFLISVMQILMKPRVRKRQWKNKLETLNEKDGLLKSLYFLST